MAGGDEEGHGVSRRQSGRFLQNEAYSQPCDPAITVFGIYPKEWTECVHTICDLSAHRGCTWDCRSLQASSVLHWVKG